MKKELKMPLNKYFKGKGEQVQKSMKKKYGNKKGKQIFYATAKKQGMEPSDNLKKRHGVK